MNKVVIALMIGFCVIFAGCTSPTQPFAERDLKVASEKFDTIVFDLSIRAKQAALNAAYDKIKNSNDPVVREAALNEMSDMYQDVEFLVVNAERAQAKLRDGREWVRAQRGVFTVLKEEYDEAKTRVDAKAGTPVPPMTTTQEVVKTTSTSVTVK